MESTADAGSSGYSSMLTSPQSSNEDLLIKSSRILESDLNTKIELKLKPRSPLNFDSDETEDDDVEIQPEECDFIPVYDPNEMDAHREWYDKLLMFRIEFQRGQRGPFPPFPPPPLPSSMIAASRAVSYNSFEAVKKAATTLSSKSPSMSTLEKRAHRFSPSDFQPLPPPHVYLSMIKTLAPHQYIDLTYALAGSVLLEMGVKVPEEYPPLPPKIEPFRDLDAEELALMTEMSSQSSSEGEYSDASEHSKFIDKLKRRKNRERRAAREVRITARNRLTSQELSQVNDAEEQKKETFSRETVYKEKTLATFIKRRISRRPPLPPPFFFPPNFRPPRGSFPPQFIPPPPPSMLLQIPFPMDIPFDPPVMCLPLYLLSPPETPPCSASSSIHNNNNSTDIERMLNEKMSMLE